MVIGIYGLKNFALFLVKSKVARLDFLGPIPTNFEH